MIEIYFNERSIHEQFYNRTDAYSALKVFFSVLNLIGDLSVEHRFFRNNDPIKISKALRDEYLIATIDRVPDRSLKQAIIEVWYSRLRAIDWTNERAHSPGDVFACNGDQVTETSMAELAERTFRNTTLVGTLFNFPKSRYAGRDTICVTKNNSDARDLQCVEERLGMATWLSSVLQLRDLSYDYHSPQPPNDERTVLRDRVRFARTNQINGGRRVYKEVETGYYWYVDNLHFGTSAHLEVFDPCGMHIGEADVQGTLDETKRDPTKRMAV